MPSYNSATLIGHLGRDPEEHQSKTGGNSFCTFSLATTDGYGDKKETNWHNIIVFGKLSEVCLNYLKKGSLVLIVGRISYLTREKEGVKTTKTNIMANEMKMLDRQEKTTQTEEGEPF